VRRRYPGTKFAEMATLRRDQLRAAAEKKEESTKAPVKIAPPFQGDVSATPQAADPQTGGDGGPWRRRCCRRTFGAKWSRAAGLVPGGCPAGINPHSAQDKEELLP